MKAKFLSQILHDSLRQPAVELRNEYNKMPRFVCLTLLLLVAAMPSLFAQHSKYPSFKNEIDNIRYIFFRASTPLNYDKRTTILFSVKLTFSATNTVDTIYTSKYTPAAIQSAMANVQAFRAINWRKLYGADITKGEVVVIPFGFYDKYANTPLFNAYKIDGLFDYGDGHNTLMSPVILLQPIVLHPTLVH